jgi:DHA2 family multidrug resistance protein
LIGIAAVLLGSLISTVYGRITTFGLADLRGAIGAGFDEGAWITTAATVGQMCIGPIAAWFGLVFGPRRVLLVSASVFALASALIPVAPDLASVLVGQAVAGLASGTFIPLTISFVLQSLKPALWPYGIAAYGLNLELSLNVPASLEGWYIDNLSWRWIFWQGALLALPMLLCISRGMPRQPINRDALRTADGWGMFFAAAGFSMLYAALDQGNRLDWLNSGTIVGLLLGAGVLITAFIVQVFTAEHPWIMPRFLLQRNIAIIVCILVLYRFIILSTSYVIPQYLTTVQDFRALQVGKVLLLIALPQFILGPAIAVLLRWIDPRFVLAIGLWCVGIACFMASFITDVWATDDFLKSQILQAAGQSAALISLVLFAVRHLRPADAMTFGVLLQTGRLLGGEAGNAFMQTYVRMREQADSNLLGLHVVSGTGRVFERLALYTDAVAARSVGAVDASSRAFSLLALAVRNQADVLSYSDGFAVVAMAVILMLLLVALLRPAPTPP